MIHEPEGYKKMMNAEDADLFSRFLQKVAREKIPISTAGIRINKTHGWVAVARRGEIKSFRAATRKAINEYLTRDDDPAENIEQATRKIVNEFLTKVRAENLDSGELVRRTGLGRYAFDWEANPPLRITERVAVKIRNYLALPILPYVPHSYVRESCRAAKMGERNPRWNGGIAEYENHAELKRQRLVILRRASGKCEICGDHANRVHHVDGDKSNHATDNLLAVCKPCHWALHTGDSRPRHQGQHASRYRKLYGMTIAEMAESVSVSPSIVAKYLKGHRKFNPEILARLANLPAPDAALSNEAQP
jgi:hypothetical protein